jgi:hypothetical protein
MPYYHCAFLYAFSFRGGNPEERAAGGKRKLVLRDATSLEPKWQQTQDDGTVKAQWSLPPPVNKRKPEIQKQTKLDFRTSDLHNWTWDLARPPSQDRD